MGFDELSEDELIKPLGEPHKRPLLTISGESPAPSRPEYLVECLSLDQLDARLISDQVSIIDFGESYDMHSPPEDLEITASFRPLSSSSTILSVLDVTCGLLRAHFTKCGPGVSSLRILWTTTR
jgi:hypothetical protein